VRRGAASCRAMLGSCPVAAAVRAAAQVPSPPSRRGWPSAPRRRDPGEGRAAQRVSPVARCPDAGQAGRCPVRLVRSAVGMSVQPVERTSNIHASGVQASGAIQVSGRTGLRCPRRCRRPVCALDPGVARYGGPPRPDAADRRAPVVCGRRGRLPASVLTGRGWRGVGRGWLARGLTVAQGRRGRWSRARVPAGGGEPGTEQVLTGPRRAS
jgi:hypothetical protein